MGFNRYRAGPGWVHCKCGLGAGTLVPGHVGSLLSASGSRREEKATPPARRRRRSRMTSVDPGAPPLAPLPHLILRVIPFPAEVLRAHLVFLGRRHPGRRRESLAAGTRAGVARVPSPPPSWRRIPCILFRN